MAKSRALVDGQVVRGGAPATGRLKVHALVLVALGPAVQALQIRLRRPPAIAKAVRAGG